MNHDINKPKILNFKKNQKIPSIPIQIMDLATNNYAAAALHIISDTELRKDNDMNAYGDAPEYNLTMRKSPNSWISTYSIPHEVQNQ